MDIKKYLSEQGKKGGNITKEKYGSDYYAMIGRMGAKAKKKKALLEKQAVDKKEQSAS